MKFKAITLTLLALLTFGNIAHAQQVPIPMQGSPAAGGNLITLAGSTFNGIVITWNAGTTARYMMVFDGTPAAGSTTSCSTTQATGCLALCLYLTESTTAPNRFTLDYTMHPVVLRSNPVVALSTGAGCGTYTADTNTEWFYSQVNH